LIGGIAGGIGAWATGGDVVAIAIGIAAGAAAGATGATGAGLLKNAGYLMKIAGDTVLSAASNTAAQLASDKCFNNSALAGSAVGGGLGSAKSNLGSLLGSGGKSRLLPISNAFLAGIPALGLGALGLGIGQF